MRGSICLSLLLAALCHAQAEARVGQGVSITLRDLGRPVTGELDPDGNGVLAFESKALSVACSFEKGICRQVVYRAVAMDYRIVNHALAANAGGHDWTITDKAAQGNAPSQPQQWIRSDKRMRATLLDNTLTIRDTQWQERPEALPGAEGKASAGFEENRSAPVRRTPDQPDRLPRRGTSRQAAIKLIGKPVGSMVSNGREVLVYPWGKVWLRADTVVGIE